MKMKAGEIKQFDVFVMPLMEGSLTDLDEKKKNDEININHVRSIGSQLMSGLKQLTDADVCHNDLKPANVLYNEIDAGDSPRIHPDDGDEYNYIDLDLKIGDFGQANKGGGTPGWTTPQFRSKREPGKSDMYSMGLVLLYALCEDTELFYALRDNYVPNDEFNKPWMTTFRKMPEIEFVMKMMDLGNQPTVDECEAEWKGIEESVEMITRARLSFVPNYLLKVLYETHDLEG